MEPTEFEINGVEYNVIKRGLAQANQVAELGRWLAIHGTPAVRAIQSDPDYARMGGLELVSAIIATLEGEALIELFSLVFGCGVDVSNEQFDVALLVDGIMALYNNQPAIKRLVGRFFSVKTPSATEEDSSTKSE